MTGHTAVKKGKAVIVFLKDGTQIRGQYAENRGRFIVLADGTRIQKVDLRCVTIDRKQTSLGGVWRGRLRQGAAGRGLFYTGGNDGSE